MRKNAHLRVLSSRWGNTEGKQWQIEAVISTWEKETGLPCSEKERILKDMGLNGIKWNMGLHEMLLRNNNIPWYNFASLLFKERKRVRSIPFGFNNTWQCPDRKRLFKQKNVGPGDNDREVFCMGSGTLGESCSVGFIETSVFLRIFIIMLSSRTWMC